MPNKQKLTTEEKVSLARQCLAGKISISQASQQGGVDWVTVKSWIRQYEAEGAAAFLPSRKNRVYSAEVKEAAVKSYQAGQGSLEEICREYGIRDKHTLRSWLKVYNGHGDFNSRKNSGGGSYMKQGRQTTQAERVQIARECIASGKNYGELAQKYQVSYQQVRIWTLRFEELGEPGLEDRRGKRKKDQTPRTELEMGLMEIEQLKHKLYLSEMENRLLKKLDEIERREASHK